MEHLRRFNQSHQWGVRQVLPILAIFMSRPHLAPSDKKYLVIRGASAPLQSMPPIGRTISTTHPGYFHVEAASSPFWQEISCDKGSSAPLQSMPPIGRTISTTHPGYFHVEATSSPFWQEISCDKWSSAPLQSKPPKGRTISTTHPGYFHVEATSNPFWQEIGYRC